MTIIAAGVYKDFNIIAADAIVQQNDVCISYKQCRMYSKIFSIDENNYVTLVGDECVVFALSGLLMWAKIRQYKFDLSNPLDIEKCFIGAEKYRKAAKNGSKTPLINPQNVTLYLANREKIICWDGIYDKTKGIHILKSKVPKKVKKNTLHINYGGEVSEENVKMEDHQSQNKIVNEMKDYDTKKRLNGKGLPYMLMNKFTTIIMPQDTNKDIIENYPYKYLTDIFTGYFGGAKNWVLMNSPDYRWSPF